MAGICDDRAAARAAVRLRERILTVVVRSRDVLLPTEALFVLQNATRVFERSLDLAMQTTAREVAKPKKTKK